MSERVATIRWGRGRTHLYDWEAVRTVCGIEAPPDWREIDGGVTYEATRHRHTTVNCARCELAATAEVVEHCRTDR